MLSRTLPLIMESERCRICEEPAQHKVMEYIPVEFVSGGSLNIPTRHPFTAYVCSPCFVEIFGPKAEEFFGLKPGK